MPVNRRKIRLFYKRHPHGDFDRSPCQLSKRSFLKCITALGCRLPMVISLPRVVGVSPRPAVMKPPMCGRRTLRLSRATIAEALGQFAEIEHAPRHNIAPTRSSFDAGGWVRLKSVLSAKKNRPSTLPERFCVLRCGRTRLCGGGRSPGHRRSPGPRRRARRARGWKLSCRRRCRKWSRWRRRRHSVSW